jgi:hypothetical protein
VKQADGRACNVDLLIALRINEAGTRMIYVHTFTPRTGLPIAPVEVTALAALAAAAAASAAPTPPLSSGASSSPEVPKVVDWESYLDVHVDVDMAFFVGLGI